MGEKLKQSIGEDKFILPAGHSPGMRVPEGGSMCANCEYLGKNNTCKNENFVRWNGSNKLPASANEYCSDWFEPLNKSNNAMKKLFKK